MVVDNLQLRRGTEDANDVYIGKRGEITFDYENNIIHVHDGDKMGGTPIANACRVKNPNVGTDTDTTGIIVDVPYAKVTKQGVISKHGTRSHTIPTFSADTHGLVPKPHASTITTEYDGAFRFLRSDGKWFNVVKYYEDKFMPLEGGTFTGDVEVDGKVKASNVEATSIKGTSINGTSVKGTSVEATSVKVANNFETLDATITGSLTSDNDVTAKTLHGDLIGTINDATTAVTQTATDKSTKVATTEFVHDAIADELEVVDALRYKGTLTPSATAPGAFTPKANAGDLYKASNGGYIDGVKVNAGDVLICNVDNTAAATSSNYSTIKNNWSIVVAREGTVTGPSSSINNRIAVFDGTSGVVLKDSGYTIETSVPQNAVFTDHITSVTTTGTGNGIASISADSNGAITATSATFVTFNDDASTSKKGLMSATDKSKLDKCAPITIGSTDLVAGSSTLASGTIYLVFE